MAPWIEKLLSRYTNPTNLTRLHLTKYSERYGYDIGDYSYGAPIIRHPSSQVKLTIGRYCSIADKVEIFMGGNHRMDWITTYPFSGLKDQWPAAPRMQDHVASRGHVTIGSDVWIGSGATIMSGVTIGHGAVIGARAVVTRDVAPYALVAGNPAREIRKRFDEATIERLLATRWWQLDGTAILPLIPYLQATDIKRFIEEFARLRPSA
ncbi:MAG: CatB-related O-acetyltransferase [Rickettsiales bacterium]|nr:CatB-related O-acetyltransferase [Rickettsiales bacterium]